MMSKCREAYEKRFGLPWAYDVEHCADWQAAWEARGEVDAKIVRDHSFKIQSGSPHRQIFDDAKEAIEQEQCK